MRFVSLAVLLMSLGLGRANCNDLRVRVAENAGDIIKLLPYHSETVCDEDGSLTKVWERSVNFYGGWDLGIGCDLMMQVEGKRTRYEFDMNWCWISPGAIEVEHWEGPHLKYCIEEGTSRLNGDNPGVVTFYGLSSNEDADEIYCPDSDSDDINWVLAGVLLGISVCIIGTIVASCYCCGGCCFAPSYSYTSGPAATTLPQHTVAPAAQGAVQYNQTAGPGAELHSSIV